MRLARLGPLGSEIPVLQEEGEIYDLRSMTHDLDGAFFESDGIARATEAALKGNLPTLADAAVLRVGAPIATPGKIICVGLNYRDHARETGASTPQEPILFLKDPSTIIGPYDDILIPPNSDKTDWEIELGVVIGSTARYLASPEEAGRHIAGYAISHDVSERAYQLERGGQWDKGKSCETFNPLGPFLLPARDMPDHRALGLRLWVNGFQRQQGTTANMIFNVEHLIWYISQFMVLRPGDLINTGTPAGVALGLPDTPYLRDGDVVELQIDNLGAMRQRMVQS